MILILKHVAIEGPGSIGPFLGRGGWDLRIVELAAGGKIPERLDGVEAVICLGGPMNVYEEASFPFLKQEDALIKDVVMRGMPFLGICLGAQLLSKACGGKVYKAPAKEMGWSNVSLTPDGVMDPLFQGAGQPFTVFQWHEDTFSIPEGGVLLATSARCRNQAFRMGSCAYGFQFHIEVTPDMVAAWAAAHMQVHGNQVDGAKLLFETYERRPAYDDQASKIYRNFEEIIRVPSARAL